MIVEQQKIATLIARPFRSAGGEELRREGGIFLVGCALPPQATLETIFDSDCLAPSELFHFHFDRSDAFSRAEELVRLVKKNFRGYVVGQFGEAPSAQLIDHAYAAGIDFFNIPLRVTGHDREKRLAALAYARTVFPKWAATVTMHAEEAPPAETMREIDTLLAGGILPLLTVTDGAEQSAPAEIGTIFEYLLRAWRRHKATVKPLAPLLYLTTPLVPASRKGLVSGLFDKVYESGLRTSTDLRRLLRVREVEKSFESAGL